MIAPVERDRHRGSVPVATSWTLAQVPGGWCSQPLTRLAPRFRPEASHPHMRPSMPEGLMREQPDMQP